MSSSSYSQYHECRIGGDITGNLTRGCVIDRLSAMRRQEETIYSYRNATTPPPSLSRSPLVAYDDSTPLLNPSWREKICHWSFNVIDHFDLSREVVAVSMTLFDRFLATRGNRCTGNTALLASLTTLHIAIKAHELRKIKLATLANLSRGQFGPKHIEEMEWHVLNSLNWLIHPPTSMSFLSHLLLLLPSQVSNSSKEDIYSLTRYITELSVCDSSFVEINPSAVAFSAILNTLEDRRYRRLIPSPVRDQFLRAIATHVGLRQDAEHVTIARPKLKRLWLSSLGQDNLPPEHNMQQQQQQQHHQRLQSNATVESVTSSVNGMQIQENKAGENNSSSTSRYSRHSRSISEGGRHSRSVSEGGITGQHRSRHMLALASPQANRARAVPSAMQTGMSTSSCSISSRSSRSAFSSESRSPMTSLLPAS